MNQEIISALKEMREINAALFRAIHQGASYFVTTNILDIFESEMKRLKIKNGFGKRCDELIKKLKRK